MTILSGAAMPSRSKIKVQLDLLTSVETGDVVTQMTLSKRIGIAVGLINALLKRAVHKGHVKAKAVPYKRYAYYLTPKGFAEKGRLVAQYLDLSLEFFRRAQEEYAEIFSRAYLLGIRRVTLIGSGELAEIALIVARESGIAVAGIWDEQTNKDRLHSLPVIRSADEAVAASDAVLITESRTPQAAFDAIRPYIDDALILAPAIFHISRVSIRTTPEKKSR